MGGADRAGAAGAETPRALAPAVEPGDPWGAAVVRFADGLARRDVDPLLAAAARYAGLGAPVPAQSAAWLAAALSSRRAQRPCPAPRGVDGGGAPGPRSRGPDAGAAGPARPGRGVGGRDRGGAVPRAGRRRPVAAVPETPAVPLELRVLGRAAITIDGAAVDPSGGRARARSTLRLLAMRAGDVVHRDVLAARLWPDAGPEAALRSLQVAVSSLRSVLGGRGRRRLLARDGEGYRFGLPAGSRCDLRELEARSRWRGGPARR